MGGATQADRDTFRELFARIASDPAWIRRVSQEITDAIHRELPELDVDEGFRMGTFASTQSVLTMMADLIRLDQPPSEGQLPPAAVGYAREFVRHGVSIDALLRAYHVGHSIFFGNWVTGVHEYTSDADSRAGAIELGAKWTFDYIQALNRELVARYEREREQWVRSAVAVRAETVGALLAEEPVDAGLASQRLRYELDRHHLAYVVWSDQDRMAEGEFGALERAALEFAQSIGAPNPLIVPFGPQLVAAWIGSFEPITVPATGLSAPACTALGAPGVGVTGFRASHREALHARRVVRLSARGGAGVTLYENVSLTALATVDLALAREFAVRELGILAEQDDDTLRLAATLRVYLEENASPRRAAQRLGVHENTIKNRIRTVGELLGRPPEERIAERLVALRVARLTHPPATER
jgi:PucR C-terminal helix-turn-helix domain/GGDEF-like domain